MWPEVRVDKSIEAGGSHLFSHRLLREVKASSAFAARQHDCAPKARDTVEFNQEWGH